MPPPPPTPPPGGGVSTQGPPGSDVGAAGDLLNLSPRAMFPRSLLPPLPGLRLRGLARGCGNPLTDLGYFKKNPPRRKFCTATILCGGVPGYMRSKESTEPKGKVERRWAIWSYPDPFGVPSGLSAPLCPDGRPLTCFRKR